MKQFAHVFIISCFILIVVSCGRSRVENKQMPALVHAEEVMFERPDSALHILEAMPIPSARTDKENHALWCLLVTQAKYKQMMKIPSDSLIKIAYNYYKPTENARRKAMSALYMGGVSYNLGNIEKAIQYYLEAQVQMEKTNDYQLGYLVMSGLGRLYLYRNLIEYAFDACLQAYDYAVKDTNMRYQMVALQYLARCYCLLNKLDKAEQVYKQSSALALQSNNIQFYDIIQQELALVYIADKRFYKSLATVKTLQPSSQTYLLKGQIYLSLTQPDSAFYYLEKALNTDNIYTKKSIYETLYQLTDYPKFHCYMKEYCDSLLYYNDTILSLDKGKEIIAYKEKYNNEKLISDKQKLKLEKANVTYWWMFTIVMALLLAILLIYIYLRKQIAIHKKEDELTSLALQLHQKELEVEKNESYIAELQSQYEENNKKEELYIEQVEMLDNLKKENERLCLEKNMLHEKIASYSVSSHELSNVKILSDKLLLLEKREKELCSLLLTQIPFLRKLHLKPVYLNDTELNDICKITDDIFQNFTRQLLRDVPSLSEHEMTLCCLIKLRFSIAEISVFLNIAPASVSRSKLRIKNKIYSESGEESKEKSLDIWLWEY